MDSFLVAARHLQGSQERNHIPPPPLRPPILLTITANIYYPSLLKVTSFAGT